MQPLSSVALVESNNTDRDETNAHSVKKMNRAVFSAPEPLILFFSWRFWICYGSTVEASVGSERGVRVRTEGERRSLSEK